MILVGWNQFVDAASWSLFSHIVSDFLYFQTYPCSNLQLTTREEGVSNDPVEPTRWTQNLSLF
jgi:hypothetical protein